MADPEIDPLLPGSPSGDLNSSRHKHSPKFNPDNEANLDHAVNDFYEAVVEGEDAIEDDYDEDVLWLIEQRKLNKTLHWFKRPSVLMVGVCVFFIALGQSAGQSTKQIILFKLACNSLIRSPNNGPTCDPTDTQVIVSNLHLWFSVVMSIATIVASGKIGSLSDQYGRKPFIVLIFLCFLIQAVVRYWVMSHFSYLKFKTMVLTEFMGNVCGGVLTLVTITNCYITDVVEPHERIYCLGLSIAFLFVGYSMGPLVGNYILKVASKVYPPTSSAKSFTINTSSVANILSKPSISTESLAGVGTYSTVNKSEYVPLQFEILVLAFLLLFSFFILPESRSSKARKKSRSLSRSLSSSLLNAALDQQSVPLKERLQQSLNFLQPLKLLTMPEELINPANKRYLKAERIVVIILVTNICYLTAIGTTLGEIYILHGIYRYNWDTSQIGVFLAVACSSRAFVLLIVSPIVNHKILQRIFKFRVIKHQFDMIDFSLSFGGLFCEGLALLVMVFAKTSGVFYFSLVFSSLATLSSPSLNSSVIKFFPESKVGELFGAIALVKNVFTLATPIILLTAYKKGIQLWGFPGLPFLISSVLCFSTAFLMIYVKYLLNLNRHLRPTILTRSNSIASLRSNSFSGSVNQLKPDKILQGPPSFSSDGGSLRRPSISNFNSQNSFGH